MRISGSFRLFPAISGSLGSPFSVYIQAFAPFFRLFPALYILPHAHEAKKYARKKNQICPLELVNSRKQPEKISK